MNQTEEKKSSFKKWDKKSSTPVARRVGYIFSIIFMIIFLYILRHLREWGVTFLTEDFERCLWYIELAIYVTIAGNVLFIIFDPKWFRHFLQAAINAANALSTIMIYVIFPFAVENAKWAWWLKLGILLIFIITVISILVELIKGIRYLVRDSESD